jgi:PAS domain S-box-containing protein
LSSQIDLYAMEETVARLTAYQEQLQKAGESGQAGYDRVFNASPAGIGAHEIDLAKRYVRVNPEEVRQLGYAAGEMIGRDASDFHFMREFSARAMDKKLSGGPLRPFVLAFRKKNGTAVMMALIDRHLKNAKGEIAGICTVMMELDTAAKKEPM